MSEVLPLHPYDVLLLVFGLLLLTITLGARLLQRFSINSTYLYLLAGVMAGPGALAMAPDDPLAAVPVLERVAELAVIVGLIVLGIRVGRPLSRAGWRAATRLVVFVMPASILAVAGAAVWLLQMPLGPAVLLGAILAPTDPILAGPVEEESPEEDPEDQFGLSAEAGLNDGFAFPFVYLGLYLTARPDAVAGWLPGWVLIDLFFAVAIALPLGLAAGRLCGRVYVRLAGRDAVSRKRRLFVPLALLLAVYGLVEAIGGYGFLAAFTAGHGFRHAFEGEPARLAPFADFTESVDELAKAAVLAMVGALLPWGALWAARLDIVVFALGLFFVVRPILTLTATARGGFRMHDRLYWSWFGIRGIGSIYYMAYALRQGLVGPEAMALFTATLGTVLLSIVIHGASVRPLLRRYGGRVDVEE